MGCLTGARMNMSATVLHQNDEVVSPGYPDLDEYGEWVDSQDPLTGEIIRIWKPFEEDDPDSDDPDVTIQPKIRCIARGVVDGGIRVAGTTEWIGADYKNIEFVKLWTPPSIFISKRDRVTNIADPKGRIVWKDEEFIDPQGNIVPNATVFNVNGVTPLFDALNRHVENYIMLERAEV